MSMTGLRFASLIHFLILHFSLLELILIENCFFYHTTFCIAFVSSFLFRFSFFLNIIKYIY